VTDEDGVVRYANIAGRRMIGLKEQAIGEATLWRLVPGLQASLGLADGTPLKSSVSSREIELTYPEKRYVRLYILPFREEIEQGDGGRRFVVMLSDITSEKMTQEEVVESERVSSILLLAAGVAHEIGNPLNSLNIHLQLMERKLAKLEEGSASDKLQKSVEICRGEVDRLDGIIKNFLEAIRPQEPDFQILNLYESLKEVIAFQSNELSDRGISVEIDVGSEPPIVRADKNQMKQVFFNLLKNAMEAMEPGGQLKIITRADEEFLYLKFSDTGKGISETDLAKVFQPYQTTKKRGSGLGLMIVQRIMNDHGGHIGIDSNEGEGTVVTLAFPKENRKFRMLESGECDNITH